MSKNANDSAPPAAAAAAAAAPQKELAGSERYTALLTEMGAMMDLDKDGFVDEKDWVTFCGKVNKTANANKDAEKFQGIVKMMNPATPGKFTKAEWAAFQLKQIPPSFTEADFDKFAPTLKAEIERNAKALAK